MTEPTSTTIDEPQKPKRIYNSHTTQCEYVKRDGTQCTKRARKQFCCYHNPETREKNRVNALASYYRRKNE